MSSYTMPLKAYIEQATQFQPELSTAQKIEIGRKRLFDFDYPIFDPAYKKVFETNFIRKFYMREIGFETEGLFKFQLETWLLINMPFFNKMYESELIKYDPLSNTRLDLTHNRKKDRTQNDQRNVDQKSSSSGDGKSSTSGSSNTNTSNTDTSTGSVTDDNFKRDLNSNNPDSRLTITTNDGQGVIEYATKIDESNENNKRATTDKTTSVGESDTTGNSTTTSSNDLTTDASQVDDLESKINDIEDFVQHRTGKVGIQTYQEMVMLYRKSFLRVEQEIFKEMQELFMLVY